MRLGCAICFMMFSLHLWHRWQFPGNNTGPLVSYMCTTGCYECNLLLLQTKLLCFRKGAAYGIAAVVSGLKISAVNGFGILDTLKASLEDKASPSPCTSFHGIFLLIWKRKI